ncbi:ATP synthase F1 subunit delta [Anaerotalea alkaliphila]|uniref:ATP synthase subunit delta n=1 Tax=Anaerotalea alkaliphila TaxID=2662126 RepID=A0A7X5HUD3_9FIRM|nr:ATP synthase F1 subunit delta [Anaerotalea alkaliphila]NDL66715.1 ATP synthase F1 subunit delta [Anaerotalea alkaliphila]
MVEMIAKRYGGALFALAKEEGTLNALYKEVSHLQQLLETEKDLVVVLNHPNISIGEKVSMMESIFQEELSKKLMGLLVIVLQQSRQQNLPEILEHVQESIKEDTGIRTVQVTTAEELGGGELKVLKEKLTRSTGKTIEIVNIVDKEILGGMVIRIGDRVMDTSVRSQLHSMSRVLQDPELAEFERVR